VTPFHRLDSVAVPLDEANIDTDQLAPGRFLLRPVFPELLLHDRRFARDGTPRPDFVLNDPAYAAAQILISRRNFGVGSSREAAVLALMTAGFRCVIAVSFGDIFRSNCMQNGVLPVVLEEQAVDTLLQALRLRRGLRVVVDLPFQTVTAAGCDLYRFSINPLQKQCLLEGLDSVALTARYGDRIAAFETEYHRAFPWLT
jgi:3-isopropylmalate/(R)-2-methylmalate dehydratase small subunit